jgi:hypothetical protein
MYFHINEAAKAKLYLSTLTKICPLLVKNNKYERTLDKINNRKPIMPQDYLKKIIQSINFMRIIFMLTHVLNGHLIFF